MSNDLCELPSYEAARLFVQEKKVMPLAVTYLQRAALISCGFWLTRHGLQTSIKNGLFASLFVEAYVVYRTRKITKECKAYNK
jgi:hypothetical protein